MWCRSVNLHDDCSRSLFFCLVLQLSSGWICSFHMVRRSFGGIGAFLVFLFTLSFPAGGTSESVRFLFRGVILLRRHRISLCVPDG